MLQRICNYTWIKEQEGKKGSDSYDASQIFKKITQKYFPFHFPKVLKKKKKECSAGKKSNDSTYAGFQSTICIVTPTHTLLWSRFYIFDWNELLLNLKRLNCMDNSY